MTGQQIVRKKAEAATRSGVGLKRLSLFRVNVPLRKAIRHASHSRTESENLVVRVELSNGRMGHGEGVPRAYVTGETIESTFAALSGPDWARIVGKPADFAAVVRLIESLTLPETEDDPRGMAGNAARCALEMALLDAYGLTFDEPVGRAVDLARVDGLRRFPAPRRVRYGVAITAESRLNELRSAFKYRVYGFGDVKAKVGVEGQDDAARLRWIRAILGRGVDLRIDANESWAASELLERVLPLRGLSLSVLEQPVPHAEVDSLAELRPEIGIPIMLDESLCGYPDALNAVERGTTDFFNVRLSKCGGILPSLRLFALAQRLGLGLHLGCHPGETALLSAAGRQVASRVQGLRYVEGSYDRHILAANLTRGDLTFGYGGFARPLKGPGLGVQVDEPALEKMITQRCELTYD